MRQETEPNRFGYLQANYAKDESRAEFQFCLDRDDLIGIVERPAEIKISVTPQGLLLQEIAPGFSVDEVQAATEAPLMVSPTLRTMS